MGTHLADGLQWQHLLQLPQPVGKYSPPPGQPPSVQDEHSKASWAWRFLPTARLFSQTIFAPSSLFLFLLAETVSSVLIHSDFLPSFPSQCHIYSPIWKLFLPLLPASSLLFPSKSHIPNTMAVSSCLAGTSQEAESLWLTTGLHGVKKDSQRETCRIEPSEPPFHGGRNQLCIQRLCRIYISSRETR